MSDAKISVQNINTPGRTSQVDAAKYCAMREAYLKALPAAAPGAAYAVLLEAVKLHLPDALFPGGKTSGWWLKTVQLDLEAKRLIVRCDTKPLRWHHG